MGKTERKKELLAAYKERPVLGGVCLVKNTITGRVWLFAARDVAAQRNRFQFAVSTAAALHPSLVPDLTAHGPDSFVLEVPETLEKRPDQTDSDFLRDLSALEDLWRQRLLGEGTALYVT